LVAYVLGAVSAFWLGVLTSVSPCPLATNIAAVSYIGRRVKGTRAVLLSGLLYTLGRLVVYVALGALLVGGLLRAPRTSAFLGRYMNQLLGPILIVTGVFLLELAGFTPSGGPGGERLRKLAERAGIWGALLLGAVFALAFCPTSAALFFGGLVPLGVEQGSALLYPALYGAGTALPVVAFALVLAFGARLLGKAFERVTAAEKWARRVTGVLFVLLGVYLSLRFNFEVI
jgi:cytochrome c biogenesis protein CcdA